MAGAHLRLRAIRFTTSEASVSAFVAGLNFESRILARERAVWLALIALVGVTLFSLYAGAGRVEAQKSLIAAAQAEERQRVSGLKLLLAKIERGEVQEELPPYRDPRNPAFVGGGLASRVAALAPEPLALTAVGQSDVYPPVLRVTSASKDSFMFADEIENPANLFSGSTDLAFVIVFVYPLVILSLCYNLLAGEREQGALAMTLASARRPGALLAGKLVARALTPITATLAAVAIGIAFFAGSALLATAGFLNLEGVILLYGLFWVALAAAVDALGKSSAFNALALVGVWVVITLLAPVGINSLAGFAHPAPSRMDMTLAARAATTDADKARDAALARYLEEHPGEKVGGAGERSLRRLATQEAAFQRVESVIEQHETQLDRQHMLTDRIGFLSPALITYRALANVAGTDEARYRRFSEAIKSFHLEWREFFVPRARAGGGLTVSDYDNLPVFRMTTSGSERAGDLSALIIGVALPTLLLSLAALRGYKNISLQ
jgi:ABC-2 type transport system permease protein